MCEKIYQNFFYWGQKVHTKDSFSLYRFTGVSTQKIADIPKGELAIVTGYDKEKTIFHFVRLGIFTTLDGCLFENHEPQEIPITIYNPETKESF